MELLVERTFAIFIAISGPILTIFDLPGNTLLLLTSLMFAFFDEVLYFNGRLLSAMVLIYALGEFWEFCVGLFGIKPVSYTHLVRQSALRHVHGCLRCR